jgi:hypothetical protein
LALSETYHKTRAALTPTKYFTKIRTREIEKNFGTRALKSR